MADIQTITARRGSTRTLLFSFVHDKVLPALNLRYGLVAQLALYLDTSRQAQLNVYDREQDVSYRVVIERLTPEVAVLRGERPCDTEGSVG